MQTYPAMLYRNAVLSGAVGDQRTVLDADAELAAMGDGFARWESKVSGVAGTTAPDVAAHAAFEQAAAAVKPAGKGRK